MKTNLNRFFTGAIVLLWLIAPAIVSAQAPIYESFDWEPKPVLATLTEQEKKEASVILEDRRVIEYVMEDGGAERYYMRHRRVRINDTGALEIHNTISIPTGSVQDFITVKARTISPSGKVLRVDEDNIKEVESEGGTYKIIAIEGLEPGSEMEYLYVQRLGFNFYGAEYLQSGIFTRKSSVEIYYPEHLRFDSRLYNSPVLPVDTLMKKQDRGLLSVTVENMPAMESEKYSFKDAHLVRYEYKLAYNTSNDLKLRLYTFTQAAEIYYGNAHMNLKNDEKVVQKLLQELDVYDMELREQVRTLENYFKSNINVLDIWNLNEPFTAIMKEKYASELGVMRLYIACFEELGIDYELVVSSNRSERPFDQGFDTWGFLQEEFLYIPELKAYLVPDDNYVRFGPAPSAYIGGYALFISPETIGKITTAMPEVRLVDYPDASFSYDNMVANVTFSPDLESANLKVTREINGYAASFFRPYYHILADDKRKEIADEIIKHGAPDAQVKNVTVTNFDMNTDEVDQPLTLEGEVVLNDIIEIAGDKFLINVGALIGQQAEMYQDKPRMTGVDLEYSHGYHRVIRIEIPPGYKVSGLDALKMNFAYSRDGKDIMYFISDYKLTGNILEIDIREAYNEITLPLEVFEDYRTVINAAADFNKVRLLMEKI
ncbi:MAG: DUF3857 domain-containing protein [Bacteroidota bacterium]|nr:DUF3857 domain-containing protein [Bacteroidota bacterium]